MVHTINRMPVKETFDRMGEARLLLSMMDLSEGGGFGGMIALP